MVSFGVGFYLKGFAVAAENLHFKIDDLGVSVDSWFDKLTSLSDNG